MLPLLLLALLLPADALVSHRMLSAHRILSHDTRPPRASESSPVIKKGASTPLRKGTRAPKQLDQQPSDRRRPHPVKPPVERARAGGGPPSRRDARRRMLRTQCAAIRAGEWKYVNETLTRYSDWSVGEYRAMLQATSTVSNVRGALQIIDHLERSSRALSRNASQPRPLDIPAFAHAIAACARAGQPEQAEYLLRRLRASGAWPEVRSYNMAITAYAKKGRWRKGLDILEAMFEDSAGPAPNVVSCNAALAGCSRARRWEEALQLLRRMEADGPPPDVVTYSTAATACQRAEQWQPALELLQVVNETDAAAATAALAQAPPLTPADTTASPKGLDIVARPKVQANAFTYTASITTLTGAGKWREALEAYAKIPSTIEKNEAMLNAAVGAAASGDDWRRCLQLLDDAIKSGLTPRVSSFNMAMQMRAVQKRPGVALAILRKMRTADASANLLTYNSAFRAMASGARWKQALQLLREMQSRRVSPTLVTYNLVMSACAKAGEGKMALAILRDVSEAGLKPDVVTYSSLISALSKQGDMESVIGLIGAVDNRGDASAMNSFAWSSAVAACERAGEWEKGLALFYGLRDALGPESATSELSEAVYNAAISAAGSGGNVQEALDLLKDMEAADLRPNLRSFNACLKACERAADWDTAISLFGRIKASGAKPDQISYTSVIGALGRGGEWALAMSMWTQMELEGIEPDGLALNTLILALSGNGQWVSALELFEGVLGAGLPAARTTAAFAAAMNACAQGKQARRATELLERMPEFNLLPGPACYLAASRAYANAGEWQSALALLQKVLRSEMRPAPEMWQVVLDVCREAGEVAEEETKMILESAEREGVPLMALEMTDEA